MFENKDSEISEQTNEIISGKNAVTEFLKSGGRADVLYVTSDDDDSYRYIISLAKETGAVVKKTHPQKLSRLCGGERHQGVALSCMLCEYKDIDYIFEYATQTGRPPFIIIADGIEDPHNLGAIIRTAECAGAHGVVIPKRRGCSITAAVFRASAGACGHIPIVRANNLASEIREIKKRGIFCYGTDMDGEACYDTDLTGATALVIGSEGFGVSRLTKDLCDKIIALPLLGSLNSLNASVAAGIVMYEYVRQNMKKGAASI
jgi:rRNA methylase, putative, group 3